MRGAHNVHFYAREGKDYQFLKSAEEQGGSQPRENKPRESQPNTVNPILKMAIEQFKPETDPNYAYLNCVSRVIGQRIEPAPRYFMMKNGISSSGGKSCNVRINVVRETMMDYVIMLNGKQYYVSKRSGLLTVPK